MLHRWGTSRVSAKQLQRKDGSGYATLLTHPALDHSSVTPVALELLTELAARLPFEEAALIATKFGLSISKSQLERLIQPITSACRELTNETLRNASPLPFVCSAAARKPRLMVLEVDGVRVLGKPSEGVCDGIEIKNVTIYPQSSPSERLVVADIRDAEAFREAIKGLIALAGVTAQDILVGVGDGALWVEAILDEVCDTSITDCFHAAGYLEVVMVALGFAQPRRAMFRRAFCKGQIDVGAFLMEHLPPPEVWLLWDEEARVALRYLELRAARMRYPEFKQKGFPIGSGMIEGLNKSVIGSRMKRSGMQWSRAGAARMAALRAWLTSKHKLISFDAIRHAAYPPPSLQTQTSSA